MDLVVATEIDMISLRLHSRGDLTQLSMDQSGAMRLVLTKQTATFGALCGVVAAALEMDGLGVLELS